MSDIPETGVVYDLPFADYLACKSHFSSSELRLVLESPRLLWERRSGPPLDPNLPHFVQGRGLHSIVLEGRRDFHIAPAEYPSKNPKTKEIEYKPFNLNSHWCQDWMAKHADRDILTAKQAQEVEAWAAAIENDAEAASYLNVEGKSEVSMFAVDEETQVPMRVRIDWMPLYGSALLDVKTAQHADPRGFLKAILERGYHVQAGVYLAVYNKVAEANGLPPKNEWIFVAVQKDGSHIVKCYRLNWTDIEFGWQMAKKALRRIRFCLDNPWAQTLAYPGEKQGQIQTLQLPKYVYENTDLTRDKWMEPEWRSQ